MLVPVVFVFVADVGVYVYVDDGTYDCGVTVVVVVVVGTDVGTDVGCVVYNMLPNDVL